MKALTSALLGSLLLLLPSVLAVPRAIPPRVPNRPTAPLASPPTRALHKRADPTVSITSGVVIGSAGLATDNFNGIPFASPPTGNLRLKPPQKNESIGTFDATGAAAACPQMLLSTGGNSWVTSLWADLLDLPFFQTALNMDEDCLTINVIRPKGTTSDSNLPVLFWIFGGAFELGWSSMYDGSSLVSNAAAAGKPYIFVAVNYRVGGFGFLPGSEILADGSANLGLLDQRMGLEWVADNVASFGGDPSRVTIWGESAGAISVFDQMALYDGDHVYNGSPLFRGAIMNSGSIVPADPVDCPKGQDVYDAVVAEAGCSTAADTLQCLRGVDYATYLNAANSVPGILSYNSVALSYVPRPDGTALTDSPDALVTAGKYAAVPFIIGDQEDEGTLFALFTSNITTEADIIEYLSTLYFHGATVEQITTLVDTYSSSLLDGSPFRTGIFNEIYPGFKRIAAILGDLVFTLTRRAFLSGAARLNPSVPSWSYIASYDYGTPVIGTVHASDLLQVFYGILPNYASKSIQSYYANFVYNLDPNDASGGTGTGTGSSVDFEWPQWTPEGLELVQFWAGSSGLLTDDFRNESYAWIVENTDVLHI